MRLVTVAQRDLGAGLEILRSQVRLLRKLFVTVERTGPAHRCLDRAEHTQHLGIVAA
ncbi:MAG: hypothetical protein ACK55I_38160 [bacterium]